MADPAPEVFTTGVPEPVVEVDGGVKHLEPALLGVLEPYQITSIAMLILLAIAVFSAKAHRKIGAGLDARIAAIREQLEEARSLRLEAEALREEYRGKIARADEDAGAMIASAEREAAAIREKAERDCNEAIARRQRMAEDKIAASEREAIAEIRERAAELAAAASRQLIAKKHDRAADRQLADEVIAEL
jgi:F-type H+-transporting ATPase subunit b